MVNYGARRAPGRAWSMCDSSALGYVPEAVVRRECVGREGHGRSIVGCVWDSSGVLFL